MQRCRRFIPILRCIAALLPLASLAATPPLSASHLSLIDEAMAGAYGRPDVQFVEMRFSSCGENQWAGVRRLAFFDVAGVEGGEFVVPANPQSDCNVFSQSVLFGTQAFADLPSTPEPDFLIPPLMVPGSGKVCFQSVPAGSVKQCLTYGNFAGATEQASSFNAPGLSSLGTCSLRRVAFFNDFGNINFNEDFALITREPRNGAGVVGGVVVPPRFSDVPAASPFRPFVEALFNAGCLTK